MEKINIIQTITQYYLPIFHNVIYLADIYAHRLILYPLSLRLVFGYSLEMGSNLPK